MATKAVITTVYGVGRDGKIIGSTFGTLEEARRQLAYSIETMKSVGLEPDVVLVSAEQRVSITKVTPFDVPAPAPVEEEIETPETTAPNTEDGGETPANTGE